MAILVLSGKGAQEAEAGRGGCGQESHPPGATLATGCSTNCPTEAEEMAPPRPREPAAGCRPGGDGVGGRRTGAGLYC